MKKFLIVGSGGREHALAWALARSPQVEHIYVAPGNAGTTWAANPQARGLQPQAAATNVPIAIDDFPSLTAFAQKEQIDLTVVGPEAPLAHGIVDYFQAKGMPIFGPTRAAAQLESSKAFAKSFMDEHHIPTAKSMVFNHYEDACAFLRERADQPIVVKADGLAAGKGVIVCDNNEQAQHALHRIMVEQEFGMAGHTVVLEERLQGREVSILAFTDGKTIVPMPPSRDHKPVFDGDRGPNTGGMGAYTHPPDVDAALLDMIQCTVLQPTIAGMAARGIRYVGVLYAGLMLTAEGPKVLEFNCRFGDPEIEAILPLLKTDLADILFACIHGCLDQISVACHPGVGATVVLASPGYPGAYPKGIPIIGLDRLAERDDVMAFHAGTARQDTHIVTAGGRVLTVSAVGSDLSTALQRVYESITEIHFEGMHYRHDIGGVR